jgi:hypothetical protein
LDSYEEDSMEESDSRIRNAARTAAGTVVVAVIVVTAIFATGGSLGRTKDVTVDEERGYAVSGFDSQHVFSTSTNIDFHRIDGNTIRVHLHGTIRTPDENRVTRLEERRAGRVIDVGAVPPYRLTFSSRLSLDVYVPLSYSGELSVTSVSGGISLPFGAYSRLTLESTSGRLMIGTVIAAVEPIHPRTRSEDVIRDLDCVRVASRAR